MDADFGKGHSTARFRFDIGQKVKRPHAQAGDGHWLVIERVFFETMHGTSATNYLCRTLLSGKTASVMVGEGEIVSISTGVSP